MKINFAERNFTCDINSHHDHAGDPGEEDVGAGFHDAERVIRILEAFFPVRADDGPVGAGEPSVEGVFVAVIVDAADFDFSEIGAGVEDPFGGFVGFGLAEHRNSDAPRDLAGDVPVFQAFEVVDEDFFLVGGVELDFVILEVFDGFGGETFDVDEPLLFQHRFDNGATFVAVGDGVGDFLFAAEEALGFEGFEDFLAALGGREALIIRASGGGHATIFADDLDALEVMALADFKIVEIVGRSNLDGASAISGIGVFVGNDRNGAVGQGKLDEATNEVLVAFVSGVDSDGGIAEEGLGTSGGDDDFGMLDVWIIFGTTIGSGADFVGDIPEVTFFVCVFDFDVGEGGLVLRAEVDEFFAAINHAVVPHFLEGFIDAGDDVFIKSKSQVGPGARGTESADLEFHIAALLFDKVPDAGIEFVAVVFETGVAFFFEGAFVDDPSFEAGMVGARDIPRGFAAETIIASQGIFEGDSEAVADVEIAIGVGRRHDDREAVFRLAFGAVDDGVFGLEGAGSLPFGINARFKISRNITLCETHASIIS